MQPPKLDFLSANPDSIFTVSVTSVNTLLLYLQNIRDDNDNYMGLRGLNQLIHIEVLKQCWPFLNLDKFQLFLVFMPKTREQEISLHQGSNTNGGIWKHIFKRE